MLTFAIDRYTEEIEAILKKTMWRRSKHRGAAPPRGVWPIVNVTVDLLRSRAVSAHARPVPAGEKAYIWREWALLRRQGARYLL